MADPIEQEIDRLVKAKKERLKRRREMLEAARAMNQKDKGS